MVLQGATQPPPRLTERDLIALMESYGIGTDATVADHIQKQLDRGYVHKDSNFTFWPSDLGQALVGAYRRMDLENLWLPDLRCQRFPSPLTRCITLRLEFACIFLVSIPISMHALPRS